MSLKIVFAQINLLVGDILGNAQRIVDISEKAIAQFNADIVAFPELTISGYPPEDLLLRSGFYRFCEQALQTIINANLKTTLIFGYPLQAESKAFNCAAIIQNGKLLKFCAKQKLPNYTVFDELRYFSPGTEPCVFEIKNIKIGILICEDIWFAGPIQQVKEQGAQLILCINASPFDRNKVYVREKLLSDQAKNNHIPIIYGNLVGGQDELVFDGGSMVFNEQGKCVQQAAYFEEALMVTEIEAAPQITIHAQKLLPRLSEEEYIYNALVMGVRDYINKNNFPGAIIGLSGGIDSALTLCIACDAIGAERVQVALMPSRFSADISLEDAKQQAQSMQVKYHIIPIEPIFNTYLKSLEPLFGNKPWDTTEQNIQARIRGNLLMALSNKTGSIVLTTGNKSEMSVGYATLYGDMAGGFCVLKDIFKMMVYQLAHYRNHIKKVIPDRVLSRAPSAELAEDQVDQDSLPPYSILDEILYLYIEKDIDPIHIYSDRLDKSTVDRVIKMVDRNEYKRRQAPIGIRTTERAFGKDRRYPITSGYLKNL